jgi:chemotaxis protein methyltransferase CheR
MNLATQVELSGAEIKLVQSLLYQECGACFDESCSTILQERVRQRLQARQMDNFYSYYRLLTSREGKPELAAMLESISSHETGFFRNRPQLDLFGTVILEDLLRRKQASRNWNLRAWSAGCSTGQEAYTLGMQISDVLSSYYLGMAAPPETSRVKPLVPLPWKVEIVASDVSYMALQTAQAGIYSESQLEGVEYAQRLRYFDRLGERYAVKPGLKELVQFDMHNLKTEFLPRPSDVIVCRNVMMHFEGEEQKRLIEKFYRCLNPGGYLLVGPSESLFGLTGKFRMIHQNNATAYQRIESA